MWGQSCRTGTIKTQTVGPKETALLGLLARYGIQLEQHSLSRLRSTTTCRSAAPSAGFPVKPMPPRAFERVFSPTSPGHLHLRQRVGSRHLPAHPVGSSPTRLVDFRAAFRGLCDHGSSRQNTGQRSGNLWRTTPHTKRPITRGHLPSGGDSWWTKTPCRRNSQDFEVFWASNHKGYNGWPDFACGNNHAKYCN